MNKLHAIQKMLAAFYEETAALPTRIVLPCVIWDALYAEVEPIGVRENRPGVFGHWPVKNVRPVIEIETGHGRVRIECGP